MVGLDWRQSLKDQEALLVAHKTGAIIMSLCHNKIQCCGRCIQADCDLSSFDSASTPEQQTEYLGKQVFSAHLRLIVQDTRSYVDVQPGSDGDGVLEFASLA